MYIGDCAAAVSQKCVDDLLLLFCPFPAIDDYRRADEIVGEDNHLQKRVQEGLKRAQKLKKQSQKRDYYKILGVRR